MDLRQMEVVVAVADTGGFTAAARRLHVVQSAVSGTVRALERELGTPLFDRTTHRVALTPAGEAFVPAARTALRPNAVALRACRLGSCDEDGLCAGAGRLRPESVFSSLELVTGHLAFHGSGLAAQASGGQESFQKVLLEHYQGPDQEVRGKSCPA
ncbi:HTH-type transcriptional regulator TfdS [Streptomyces malaysiensis subsp. malaysiensis]|nr:HTH-type transcriptional regulator TfdS [Streptomyces sp. M56]